MIDYDYSSISVHGGSRGQASNFDLIVGEWKFIRLIDSELKGYGIVEIKIKTIFT